MKFGSNANFILSNSIFKFVIDVTLSVIYSIKSVFNTQKLLKDYENSDISKKQSNF